MDLSDIIRLAAVLVALAASITALVIATQDRKTRMAIAREARAHDRLSLELEYAVRMSANRNRGGSTDALERAQLSAEALALAGVVGRWAPRQYARAMNYKTPEQLRERLSNPDEKRSPRWVKDKIEAGLAVQSIIAEMYGTNGELCLRSPQIQIIPTKSMTAGRTRRRDNTLTTIECERVRLKVSRHMPSSA